MAQKAILFLIFLAQILLHSEKIESKVPAVIVFGDSTVDAGNNNQISTVLKSNFKPYGRDFFGGIPTGRFSNGRLPTDFISQAFGCKPTVPAYLDPQYSIKDFATGVCFASAGTGYDNATSDVLSVIPLWKELEYYKEFQEKLRDYLGDAKAQETIRDALYLISMGTNDFLENYFVLPTRSSQYTVEQYEIFLLGIAAKFLKDLYRLGARKITISGLPPMGCVPLVRTISPSSWGHCYEKYNDIARDFNAKLAHLIAKMNKKLPGIRIVHSNPYDIVLDIVNNPFKYGFEKAALACCASGLFEMSYLCDQYNPLTCKDASKYVFWDSFHPTEKTNFIIADH
ncbi:hypothetical protein AQUCO_00900480v1, partial [Aquilegia coerulea]